MDINLSLSVDTLRLLAEKARAALNSIEDGFEDGKDRNIEFDAQTLSDSHAHDGLAEEESIDLSTEEVSELIDDLNIDEASELVAIVWTGRGDYDASDFEQAITDARERAFASTSKYLLQMPFLADYIEAGLDTLDL